MKNIVFLISDQMQRKAVLEDERCKMENLKALCTDSVDFSRAHASNPICSPARASLLTGMLPHNHGMVDCTHTVPAYRAEYDYSLDSIPQILSRNGYDMCYYGKWHIERSYKLENFGIAEYETEKEIPKRDFSPISRVSIDDLGYKTNTICGVYSEGEDYSEEHYIYDKAMDFISRSKDSGKPFCAFLSTYAPHDPYIVPKEIYELYDDVEFDVPYNWDDGLEGKPEIYRRLHEIWGDLNSDQIREVIRCYYSCCTLVDKQIGRLVAFLKDQGLYDDTIIVFTSDHGDLCGAHGLFCKGVPAFEDVYRIPFVMKLPGNRNGGMVSDVHTCSCDLMPTLLDAAGIPFDESAIDGKNLVPFIEGKDSSEEYTVSEFFGQRYSYTQRVVWYRNFKYVFNAFDEDEMYDLDKDPDEMDNLIDNEDYEDIKKELCMRMWLKAKESDDWSIMESQYFMHRFAPVGPLSVTTGSSARFDMYNKSF